MFEGFVFWTLINFDSNLLDSQACPSYPGMQEQVKLLIPSVQVPPFLHGWPEHSSISLQIKEIAI